MKKSIVFLLLISINTLAQTKNAKPFVLGYSDEVESKILSEKRTLNVYLPEGYKANDTIHYPVIYLLDGGADEDFIHTVGLVQYNTFSWINRVPPSIVVGIANTDRKRDFTFPTSVDAEKKRYPSSGGSAKFIEFIEQELQPFIAKNYKANRQSTIIGQSLGGLLATQILFEKPELFNQYIIISPSLWWSDGALLKQNPAILSENFTRKAQVYIGVGKEGVWASTPTTPHVMELDANLLADKIRSAKNKNVRVYFDYMPEEDHATSSHPAVFNAFRLLYPKK
ncbi:alpha/beta hydrolase [Flavobacterium sp. CYK-55]|uniref:alpha/beta hydrolase n=1 Tax=Flavobacterium sp. CYK-55 TaxID=2835529 RepID=UPI001BCD4B20|nr:alpha/beta hydrolase-fold protein [Flavobacterium sp. CYK-55]MBS7786645.1 alpha/beta hydrolase [Flavobacterium sp. CYK-55]